MTLGELREILQNFEGASDNLKIVVNDPENESRLIPFEMRDASIVGMNDKNEIDCITPYNEIVFCVYIG